MEPPAQNAVANVRPLPDTVAKPDESAYMARRRQREKATQKKKLFRTVFREIKLQRRKDRLPVPRGFSSEACWRRVAAGKFRGEDVDGGRMTELMRDGIVQALTEELARSADGMGSASGDEPLGAKRGRGRGMAMAAVAAAKLRAALDADTEDSSSTGSDVEMTEARHDYGERARAPGRRVPANAAPPAAAAAAGIPVVQRPVPAVHAPPAAVAAAGIPVIQRPVPAVRTEELGYITGERILAAVMEAVAGGRMHRAVAARPAGAGYPIARAAAAPAAAVAPAGGDALVDLTREAAMAESGVPDGLSTEDVERLFALKGVGESGSKCPVCEEPRTTLVRMSRGCSHAMCAECCESFVNYNTLKEGARCFGCVADAPKSGAAASAATVVDSAAVAAGPKIMYVDPRLLFDGKVDTFRKVSFSSFQIPKLQAELDEMEPKTQEQQSGTCPLCGTVSMTGRTLLRRCANPRCCVEFCVNCCTALDKIEDRTKHLTRACTEMAAEASGLAANPGMTPCSKCGTPLFHAQGHGCHHVKCSTCSHEMCHNCGKQWTVPQSCSCPLYCRSDFKCRCAYMCPECRDGDKPCVHCLGSCPSCLARKPKYPLKNQ